MREELLQLLGALLVIAAVLVLAYLATRYLAGGLRLHEGSFSSRRLKVKEQVTVGRDQKLLLVQVGKHHLLLGASAGKITCLREFTEEESQELDQAEVQLSDPTPFQERLQAILKGPKH